MDIRTCSYITQLQNVLDFLNQTTTQLFKKLKHFLFNLQSNPTYNPNNFYRLNNIMTVDSSSPTACDQSKI